jgi:hypothetical protein
MKKLIILIIIALFITLFLTAGVFLIQQKELRSINSFLDCKKKGYPVQESYPERCVLPSGKSFTNPEQESVFCPEDVKECPGGGFVGRIPPDCNFAPCPGEEVRE